MQNSIKDSGLVSVVIPFFNREKTLGRAVDSVISQTYGNWEVVLIDDGSTDGSFAIAERYAASHAGQIRVHQQANGGPGVARNTGIAHARGHYVAILDSDDQWTPIFIRRVLDAFDMCPEVDWIYVNVTRMGEQGNIIIPSVFDDDRSGGFRKLATRRVGHLKVIEDPAFLETAIASTVKEGANSIIRRKVFDRVSYPTLRLGEDRVLTMSAISAGFRFGYIDEILMTKFHHGENISLMDAEDLDKMLEGQADLIRSLEYVRGNLPLNEREVAALRVRLSRFYFEYARLLVRAGRGYVQPLPYVVKSFITEPGRNPVLTAVGRRLKKQLKI